MKIRECIDQVRAQTDTEVPEELLVRWLSNHDARLWENVVKDYQDPADKPHYDEDTDLEDQELLVSGEWEDLEVYWLMVRIDLAHGDFDRYNNDLAMYSTLRQDWANWYNRTHRFAPADQFARVERPKPTVVIY